MNNSTVAIMSLEQNAYNVKSIRIRAGLTQQEVAALAMVDPAKVIHAEFEISPLSDTEWQSLLEVCAGRITAFIKDRKY
jgi:transcriptional regulator with XRE-family HTH domain